MPLPSLSFFKKPNTYNDYWWFMLLYSFSQKMKWFEKTKSRLANQSPLLWRTQRARLKVLGCLFVRDLRVDRYMIKGKLRKCGWVWPREDFQVIFQSISDISFPTMTQKSFFAHLTQWVSKYFKVKSCIWIFSNFFTPMNGDFWVFCYV